MYKNYDVHTGAELKALFPYMFNKPHISFTFYRGWMPIVAGVCIDIHRVLGENRELFHWEQIKEKFGTARLYYTLAAHSPLRLDLHTPDGLYSLQTKPVEKSDLQQTVARLVHDAEEETRHTCMVCGSPASPESYDGYFMTLCSNHFPDGTRSPNDLRREAVRENSTPGKPAERSGS